jgi:hypothetical protein
MEHRSADRDANGLSSCVYTHQERGHVSVSPPGGGVAPRLSGVEPVAVRVVEVVVGAAVWVVKAVEVVEVRRSELPSRSRLALALGLEGALGESGSQGRRFYRVG